MQTYILFTKLTPEVLQQMKNREQIGRNWMEKVKEKCPEVKFLEHYALLGDYDFLDIYEAPDDEMAAKVSIISQQYGAAEAKIMPAIPYKRFLELTEMI